MGWYTRLSRAWLDTRYRRTTPEGIYYAHNPIYGIGSPCSDPDGLACLARTFQILKILNRVRFGTLLDVGGSEGFLADLVQRLFATEAVSGDLSVEACKRAIDLHGVETVALDSARLPFPDASFDVVVCSEVVEHVEFPVETLLEIDRVARSVLIVTSQEFCRDRNEAEGYLSKRRDLPHTERNYLSLADLHLVHGDGVRCFPEYRSSLLRPQSRGIPDQGTAEISLREATAPASFAEDGVGAILLKSRSPRSARSAVHSEEHLLGDLLSSRRPPIPLPRVERAMPSAMLLSRLVCPCCRRELLFEEDRLRCKGCSRRYPIEAGIPVLQPADDSDPTDDELLSRLRPQTPGDHARAQALLELRRRLALPEPARQSEWDFSRSEDRDRWQANGELSIRSDARDAFHWSSTGDDPWILSPVIVLPSGGVASIAVTMRVHNPGYPPDAAQAQLFWLGEGDFTFTESNAVTFSPRNDGRVHTYEVQVGGHPGWPRGGSGAWLRFDPVNGPAEVDLYSLRILPREAGPVE